MAKFANILSQKKDADSNTDSRIKRSVFWWSSLTLLYLMAGLKLNIDNAEAIRAPWGFFISGITEEKFLIGLLIFNVFFLARLFLRVEISYHYDKHYRNAVKDVNFKPTKNRSEVRDRIIERTYKNFSKVLKMIERYLIGLIIPFFMSMVAIICLSWSIFAFWGYLVAGFVIFPFFIVFCCRLYKS